MEHINLIEIKENFEENDFENYLNRAKFDIIAKNATKKIEIKSPESYPDKNVNGFIGIFSKYKINSMGELIGYLEAFKSNKNNYLLIYTCPDSSKSPDFEAK
jgi:hypothetical protein